MKLVLEILLGLFPVIAFLVGLIVSDSFKLVRLRAVAWAIIAGGFVAVACFLINSWLYQELAARWPHYGMYIAPVIEEPLKALFVIYLIRARRVGFLVDAAIYGFAVGAGFALVENLYYLKAIPDASLLTWVVRGFGTAAMHGGTIAIFGMISRTVADRRGNERLAVFLPGLLIAVALHSLFNQFILPPVATTALLLIAFPILVAAAFYHSERATQQWLGAGLDADVRMLELMDSGSASESSIGIYLQNLRQRFPDNVLVDMLCYLRLHLELAAQAKGVILMRQAGLTCPPDPELADRFAELRHLERNIGTAGRLALMPFLRSSSRDLWQMCMLDEGVVRRKAAKVRA